VICPGSKNGTNLNGMTVMFQGSAHSDFLNLYGRATITTDSKKIKELWEPIGKAWFTDA
jgi:general stress protein 26